ncbi:MAG TPA: M23 family metallopeptidase [bacterium]|nr:M23 family metallopeptidase [bacterium]
MDPNMLIVNFPLRGVCISPNSPGSKIPSHGISKFGEEYAIDFVMINENSKIKKPYRKSIFQYIFKGLDLNDFYGYGQDIYSPVSGEVIGVESNIEERNPVNIFKDYMNTVRVTKEYLENSTIPKEITGNYVMIKVNENIYALLVHLKKGSIKVKVGQKISTNEVIGQLGHSGNSTMPHLHMQFMNSPDFKVAKGIPFVFESYEVKQYNNWVKMKNLVPKVKDIIRFEGK